MAKRAAEGSLTPLPILAKKRRNNDLKSPNIESKDVEAPIVTDLRNNQRQQGRDERLASTSDAQGIGAPFPSANSELESPRAPASVSRRNVRGTGSWSTKEDQEALAQILALVDKTKPANRTVSARKLQQALNEKYTLEACRSKLRAYAPEFFKDRFENGRKRWTVEETDVLASTIKSLAQTGNISIGSATKNLELALGQRRSRGACRAKLLQSAPELFRGQSELETHSLSQAEASAVREYSNDRTRSDNSSRTPNISGDSEKSKSPAVEQSRDHASKEGHKQSYTRPLDDAKGHLTSAVVARGTSGRFVSPRSAHPSLLSPASTEFRDRGAAWTDEEDNILAATIEALNECSQIRRVDVAKKLMDNLAHSRSLCACENRLSLVVPDRIWSDLWKWTAADDAVLNHVVSTITTDYPQTLQEAARRVSAVTGGRHSASVCETKLRGIKTQDWALNQFLVQADSAKPYMRSKSSRADPLSEKNATLWTPGSTKSWSHEDATRLAAAVGAVDHRRPGTFRSHVAKLYIALEKTQPLKVCEQRLRQALPTVAWEQSQASKAPRLERRTPKAILRTRHSFSNGPEASGVDKLSLA